MEVVYSALYTRYVPAMYSILGLVTNVQPFLFSLVCICKLC